MTHASPLSAVTADDLEAPAPQEALVNRPLQRWMVPPIGVGFSVACRIGDAKPDDVMFAIWPYIAALLVGVVVIAFFPWLTNFML